MNNKLCAAKMDGLVELMISQVSRNERRRNPTLLKCERQMRETLRKLKDVAKEGERIRVKTMAENLATGGVQCG